MTMRRHKDFIGILVMISVLFGCGGGSSGGSLPTTDSQEAPSSPPPVAQPIQSMRDVTYGSGALVDGSKDLLLDIYQPDEACDGPRPYVILIHGGGFTQGSKNQGELQSYAQQMADRGYVAVAINYRLEGDGPVPSSEFIALRDGLLSQSGVPINARAELRADTIASAIEDAVTAMRWVEANARNNCIDSGRVALWGGSAGSFIGLSVAYALDDYSVTVTKPRAVINHWGGLFSQGLMISSDPPVFIVHGDADTTVPYDRALEIRDDALAASVPYAFYTVRDADHGFNEIPIQTLTVNGISLLELEINFLDGHLMGGSPVYETVVVPKTGS
jgi:acetyl esterase/lipase